MRGVGVGVADDAVARSLKVFREGSPGRHALDGLIVCEGALERLVVDVVLALGLGLLRVKVRVRVR